MHDPGPSEPAYFKLAGPSVVKYGTRLPTVLGRDPGEGDRILGLGNDRKISRIHAEISFNHETRCYVLKNVSTKNHVIVDGHLLTSGASATLKCYSAIRIGNCRCYFLLPVVAEQRPQTLARPQVKYLDLVRTMYEAKRLDPTAFSSLDDIAAAVCSHYAYYRESDPNRLKQSLRQALTKQSTEFERSEAAPDGKKRRIVRWRPYSDAERRRLEELAKTAPPKADPDAGEAGAAPGAPSLDEEE